MDFMLISNHHKRLKHVFTQRDFNLRKRRWSELLKDYNMSVKYHLSKANMVVDGLSMVFMVVCHILKMMKKVVIKGSP